MKTTHEIKLQKARIDAERVRDGRDPVYSAHEKEHDTRKRLCLSCGAVIRKDICPHCDGDSIEEL